MNEQIRCQNCNAVMSPDANGRMLACNFCGAKLQVAVGADQIARGFALDRTNIDAFVWQLSHALVESMQDRTKLELDGKRVAVFELNLGNDLFIVIRESGSVVTRHKKMVRGIALKTTTHPVDRWVELLSKALAAFANENARVAQVLSQLQGH